MFGPKTPQEMKFYECEIELDVVQSFRLAKLTILQSKCPLWRKERLKRITSSRKAHELLRAWENYQEGKVDATKFLEIFRFVIKAKIKALDHGNDPEADAKKKFIEVVSGRNWTVHDIGLVCKHRLNKDFLDHFTF